MVTTRRTAFFISDRTGITAEMLGLSLLSQFEGIPFTQVTLPFIDTREKANEALARINHSFTTDMVKPLVFATVVNAEIRTILQRSDAHYIDFFDTFIPDLEKELNISSAHVMG